MQRLLPFLLLFLAACTPVSAPLSSPTLNASTQAMDQTCVSVEAVQQATNQSGPVDTHTTPSTDVRPKGKNSFATPTTANPDIVAQVILGRPTDTSITTNVVSASTVQISYEFGVSPDVYTSQTTPQNATAGVPLETLISGLQPNTRYYYRLHYGNSFGSEGSFVTQRAPSSTFTFDIQGDSHPERVGKEFIANLYSRTLQSAASDRPDFYITMGDDFSVDTLKTVDADTVKALYINQRQWLGLVDAPLFLVNGNHEQASLANLDGTSDNVAVWAQQARNAYYPQPAPDDFYTGDNENVEFIGQLRDYYAFTWGDALFMVIDPYWHSIQTVDNQFGMDHGQKKNRDLWNVTLGDAQYKWFKQTLETSSAKYKFVFAHHVLGTGRGGIELANSYEWGDAANLAAHRPGWDKTIQQLMADNHVTIFFQGHDHLFARQELDGVIYQTLPEPANPFFSILNQGAYLSGDVLPNSGHVRVTVSPDGVKVDYIRSYLDRPDELAFSYTLQ